MAKVIEGGKSDAYQFESLAVDLMVRLVEQYLAEYRSLLQEPDCRQALISILNIFVEAGWSKARALTYQLDDIFR